MTTDEAYAYAMSTIQDLEASGIRVEIVPSKSASSPECVAKYSGPERVAPEKWMHVSFYPTTEEQTQTIHQKRKELGWMGMRFDTGGGCGLRDWELDWSFTIQQGEPDEEGELRRDAVEDLITEAKVCHTRSKTMWIKAGQQFINLANIEFVGLGKKLGSNEIATASIYFVGSKNGIDDNLTLHDEDAKELIEVLERLAERPAGKHC